MDSRRDDGAASSRPIDLDQPSPARSPSVRSTPSWSRRQPVPASTKAGSNSPGDPGDDDLGLVLGALRSTRAGVVAPAISAPQARRLWPGRTLNEGRGRSSGDS